jgi:sugar phosphate isomerase/epimerase
LYFKFLRYEKKIQELFYKGLEQSKKNELVWGKLKKFRKAYLTDLLQALINEGTKIKAIQIFGDWLELDSYSDYDLYKRCLKENSDNDIFNIARS